MYVKISIKFKDMAMSLNSNIKNKVYFLQGPTMPALMIMLARWVPPHERSFQGALVFGGAQIGNIFGSFMSGILLADGRDWAYVFYFFGGFGIFWFVMWVSNFGSEYFIN